MDGYDKGERAAESRSGKATGTQVRDAPYPHIDIAGEDEDRNADKVPPAPEGRPIGTLDPTADPTKLGDFIVWFSEASDAALTRWGDYVTCRRAGRPRLFDGTGYSVLQNAPPATGTRYNPRYTLFGRP